MLEPATSTFYTLFFLFVIFTLLLLTAIYCGTQLQTRDDELTRQRAAARHKVHLFETEASDLIELPTEDIVLDENPVACHQQLTECTSTADCALCREMLATCQPIAESVDIEMDGDETVQLEGGKSYCLAINPERSKRCNPNTGKWILVSTARGFTLVCSCKYPGLVTQVNLFGDCDVSIGCNGAGTIADINQTPLKCVCDEGYLSELIGPNNEPVCRPVTVRDAIYSHPAFPRAPCPENYVLLNHPGLDAVYFKQFLASETCIRDPCSIDPITGLTVAGRLRSRKPTAISDAEEDLAYCECSVIKLAYGVHIEESMLALTGKYVLPNACIAPLNSVPEWSVLKHFWARLNPLHTSDIDVYSATFLSQLQPLYRPIANVFAENIIVIRFALCETFDIDAPNVFSRFIERSEDDRQPSCIRQPGRSRCINDTCISWSPRVFKTSQVEFFTRQRCFLSRTAETFYEGRSNGLLCAYKDPGHYPNNTFPINFNILNIYVYSTRNEASTHDAGLVDPRSLTENTSAVAGFLRTFPYYNRV